MSASFVEALMDHIMDAAMIPKVQIERAVGPILGIFLESALTETLRGDPVLSGPLTMICQEFPLKKTSNSQSTNIDWLMYNTVRRQLLFVELKTADTSLDADQIALYHAKQETVRREGGSFLIEDLEHLRDASQEHGKYRYILETKVKRLKSEISECHEAKIIYVVPKSAAHKVQDHADRVLTFSMLSNDITGPFAQEWRTIHTRLCALDELSQRGRNRQSAAASKAGSSANFEARLDFSSIVTLCKTRGDAVLVGYTGGVDALARQPLSSLEKRRYKWDNAVGGTGTKIPGNWIRGSTFTKIITDKRNG